MKTIVKSSLLLTVLLAALSACTQHEAVVFSAMGCGPYNAEDEQALIHYMQQESQQPQSDFIVHLGDIAGQRGDNYPEEYFARVAAILSDHNQVPTFVVLGDNEWNDQPDPAIAWQYWNRHFMQFDKRFEFKPKVWRQPQRPENFAFMLKGALFIGINKVGGRVHDENEWRQRLDDDGQWVEHHLQRQARRARAAVIFAQANPGGFNDQFLNAFVEAASRFEKPILYIHADGHQWFVNDGQWQPNIVHVQVDRVEPNFPPVRVTVTTAPDEPFLFDRRLAAIS